MKLSAVSLFAGAGGLDLGIERAGFEFVAANELEPVFCKTLLHNQQKFMPIDGDNSRVHLQGTRIINTDVRNISGLELSRGQEIHLVVGGPPCQPFSSAGKNRGISDLRGTLFLEFARIVNELQPHCLVFENVRGLITAKDQNGRPGLVSQIVATFEDLGYSCRVGLLNAADYGSFQRRVRFFLIGVRHGVAPEFLTPNFSGKVRKTPQIQLGMDVPLKPWRTLGEFLDLYEDRDETNWQRPTKALEEQLKDLPDGAGLKSPGVVESTRPGGHWGYRQGAFIADKSLPARTVTGSSSQDWIRLTDGSLRRLTLREVTMLQGFPEGWELLGTKAEKYKQVGNAVPPIFGETIGKVLHKFIISMDTLAPAKKLPIPELFRQYINYTQKENSRNGESRRLQRPTAYT